MSTMPRSDPPALTQDEANAAWTALYRFHLDELPDAEVRWERSQWERAGVAPLATTCDALLDERRQTGTAIPGGADADDLDRLFQSVDGAPVARLVEHEALPLVSALRLVYWSTLRERPR